MIIINGIEIQKFHNRYIRVFDNKIWMLLLRHNSEDGTKFSNKEDALYQTADERKYSILSTIPNGCEELKVDGKFEFFIEYPGYETGYNQWRQTNFPIYEEDSNTSVIGFEELTRRGQLVIARTYASLEIWVCVALIYLIMTLSISRFVAYLERRYQIDDRN